jgi:inositol-hexakisphosphate kinase
VYQANSGKFICHNKYFGRSLTVEDFKLALRQFLHNGCELRADLIASIIHKLERLHRMVERQDSFRFYSSSLLIMYDGTEASRY